ncbi:hypothetical protein QS304_25820, partial [Escherichia coli]|nr:hypothetical protein [Escherichia coli]
MGSCAAPSAKRDDKFITTDYLQQCHFSLGEEYEHAPPATNRQISPYLPSGRFRTGLPVEGL